MNEESPRFGLKRIEKTSVQERVYQELKDGLIAGAFVPGQSITILEMAAAMGTSTMPVREALRRLVAERALEVLPNRSVAVPLLSVGKFLDLVRVRKVLEGTAAEWAAGGIRREGLAYLRAVCDQMEAQIERSDPEGYLQNNQDFRFTIYRAAGSPSLLGLIESLWLQIGPYFNLLLDEGSFRIGNEHHRAALEALERKDGATASEAIRADIEAAAEVIVPLIPEVGADGEQEPQTRRRRASV